MKVRSRIPALALALALLSPWAVAAQGRQNLTLNLMGGVGGSLDEDDAGLGNLGYQLGLAADIGRGTLLGLRLGGISFDASDRIGALADPSLQYATISGEYLFTESYYTSGLFLGVGAYRLDGLLAGRREEDTALGLTLGVTGRFDINRRLDVTGEIAGHLLDSGIAEFFLTAMAGLAIHI